MDNITRWNSTLHMLKSAINIWKPLKFVCMSYEISINFECKKKLNDSNSGVFQQGVFEDEILSKIKEIISLLLNTKNKNPNPTSTTSFCNSWITGR